MVDIDELVVRLLDLLWTGCLVDPQDFVVAELGLFDCFGGEHELATPKQPYHMIEILYS